MNKRMWVWTVLPILILFMSVVRADPTYSVVWNSPPNAVWSTSQTIDHNYTPTWDTDPFTECDLVTDISGTMIPVSLNATPLINDTQNTITYNYGADNNSFASYITCIASDGYHSTSSVVMRIDSTPPSQVPGFTNDSQGDGWAYLTFDASTDSGSGIQGYAVWQDGVNIANTTDLFYNATGVSNAAHSFFVGAIDYAGNYGSNSTELNLVVFNSALSDCTVISNPGAYNLTSDMGASATSACIHISADNVVLDCQGYSLIGNGTQGCNDYYSVGQYAGIFSDGFSNITIKNCQVSEWGDAIVLENSDNITIFNLTSSNNNCGDTYGGTFIQLANVNDSHFYNFTSDTDYCGFVCGGGNCHYNIVENGSITNNNMCSAVSWNAGDTHNNVSNVVMNLTQTSPDMTAIFIGGGSTDNLFSNNTISISIDPGQNIHYIFFEQGDGDINNWNDSFRGNYWTNITRNGYSDICADANYDGICDQPFDLITETTCTAGVDCSNNTDYLPLSNQYTPLNLGFSVTWNSPANNSVLTNGDVDFNFTPIWYDVPMTYCEVSLNGLGNTNNQTPLTNDTINTITWSNLSDANYVGYIECFNGTDQNTSDTIYFTVNTTALNLGFSVTWDAPANNSILTNATMTVNYTPIWYDQPDTVCALWESDDWTDYYNATPLVNGTTNNITYTFSANGSYYGYISCGNGTASNGSAYIYFTVNTTALNLGFSVSLDHPANNTMSTDAHVDFGFIPVWYDSPLDVCGLYLNGSWAADNSTPLINNSVMNAITYDFTGMDGPWEFYIICQNSTASNQTGTYNIVIDTQPPSQVPGFTNDSAGYTWIHLVWNASSDTGTGLSNYVLYENGVWIGNTTGLSANDTMLSANTTYTYDLSACDYAGNCAANSTIFASTLAIPPSPPAGGGGGYTPPSTTGNATQNPPSLGISGTPGSDLFSITSMILLVVAILVLAYFANKRK